MNASLKAELTELAIGILNLQQRQRTKLFVRRDRFGRCGYSLCRCGCRAIARMR